MIRGRRMRVDVHPLSEAELSELLSLWWTDVTARSVSETVPRDIQEILDRTPKDEIAVLPYREEMFLWLQQFIPSDDTEVRLRGWVPAVVRGRKVRADVSPLYPSEARG